MNVLIVHAHPVAGSFNHALVAAATRGFEANGHRVTALDLYAMDYRATMTEAEWRAYESDEPVLDPVVAEHVELLRSSDALVFIYPTWWSAMPAIMRGWIERTLLKGVAFDLDQNNRLRPRLQQIRHLVGISSYGSRWWYVKAINDNGRRTVFRTIRYDTGIRTKRTWLGLYAMDRTTPERRQAFLERVEQRMRSLR